MAATYDKYYQTENFFGNPYPELIEFMSNYPKKGKVLDLGCGQGRDSIALARLGYNVTGIDYSKVGIDQMNEISKVENLDLKGEVGDIYLYNQFQKFDIILLDSMLHFAKKDKEKEIKLIQTIVSKMKNASILIVCIPDKEKKIQILNQAIDFENELKRIVNKKFKYTFEDTNGGYKSEMDYRMIVIEK